MTKRSYRVDVRGRGDAAPFLRGSNLFCTGAYFDHRRQSAIGLSVQRDRDRAETG